MTEENVTTGKGRSLNWWLRFISIVVVAFVFLIALYSYLFIYIGWTELSSMFSSANPAESELNATNSTVFADLNGELFLSAVLEREDGSVGFVPVIVLPETDQFAYLPVDQLGSGPIFSLQHAISDDLVGLTFLGWPFNDEWSHQTPAIYRANTGIVGATSLEDIIQSIQNTAALALEPDSEDYFRQGPVIANSGEILYASLSEDEFDSEPAVYATLPAEDWTIYRVDANNERHTLVNGLTPKWVDDTKFVFLKNDGVYLYNINNDEETLVWNLGFTPTLAHAFDVSDDGRFLAIANHEAGTVTIIENNGWEEEVTISVFSEVAAKVAGITFAPDNAYLAIVQLIGSNEDGTEGFPRLTYYSLENREFIQKYVDLEDPNLEGIYLTDWK